MTLSTCTDEFDDRDEVWNCGLYLASNDIYDPAFQLSSFCREKEAERNLFSWAGHDGMPLEVLLPDGTGAPYGRQGQFKRITLMIHYILIDKLKNGSTSSPGFSIRMHDTTGQASDDRNRVAEKFMFSTRGVLPPHSVSQVSGDIKFNYTFHIIAQFLHTHGHGIEAIVRVTNPGNNSSGRIIYHENPQEYKSFHQLPEGITIHAGEVATTTCVYNNTSNEPMIVHSNEMCDWHFFYYMDEPGVSSRYSNCVHDFDGSFHCPINRPDCDKTGTCKAWLPRVDLGLIQ